MHEGFDFPPDVAKEIKSWCTRCLRVQTPERLTTKGLNTYNSAGDRSKFGAFFEMTDINDWRPYKVFHYLSPKRRLDHTDLQGRLLDSKTYHLICSPSRCIEMVKGILEARPKYGDKNDFEEYVIKRPIFVWEPVPDSCKSSELQKCFEALQYVDVISPNLLELNLLFEDGAQPQAQPGETLDTELLRRRCNELLTKGFGSKPSAVVVRLAERGCYVAQVVRHMLLPAFHQARDELKGNEKENWTEKVVDPTGGGNAFLGGFCIGLLSNPNSFGMTEFEIGAIHGTVAASFAIEQPGMPRLSRHEEDGQELWNGESVHDRMNEFTKRLHVPKLSKTQLEQSSLFESFYDHEISAVKFVRKGEAVNNGRRGQLAP